MYKATEVPPGNKPIDPRADPKYYDYTWTNWLDIVDPKTEVELLTEENARQYFYSQKKLYLEAEQRVPHLLASLDTLRSGHRNRAEDNSRGYQEAQNQLADAVHN